MMRLSSIANANVRALFETTKKIGKKRVKTSFFCCICEEKGRLLVGLLYFCNQ